MPLSSIDRSSREKQNTSKNSELNCTLEQMNLPDIYRIFLLTDTEY
jgi:hypothetical protein